MGRCHEFGSQIREGCGHPMRAGEQACACPECGVVCHGQFDGCPDVWARGPRPISLTITPALDTPRLRALAAGPAPASTPPRPVAPPPAGNVNGNGNGYATPPPPPPPGDTAAGRPSGAAGGARTEVLRWFEDAFDELRNELHAVVSAVTRQQAMLAELLDSREAELRVVMVAESLPELAGEAAAKALNDQSDGLAEVVAASLDDFRASMHAAEQSTTAVMDGMRELLRRVEITAEVNAEEARLEGAGRLEALKNSVGRQLKPVSIAVAELAAYIETAEEREAARTKALKASVTRQLQPLAAAVERSDSQLAEIHARLDALGAPKLAPARSKRSPATKKPAPATKRPAPRSRAATPDPDAISIVYDYEAPPAKPAPPPSLESLIARRRAATRRPPLAP